MSKKAAGVMSPFLKNLLIICLIMPWKAATLLLQDLRVGLLPGNDDGMWPHMGPSKADEHTSGWRTHGSVSTAGVPRGSSL